MTAAGRHGPSITLDDLNRALLARQHLLSPGSSTPVAEVDHLVGLQSQAPTSPYPGLWSRLDGFRTDDLSQRFLDRSVTRIAVMRGTVHLVTADDALELPGALRPLLESGVRTGSAHAKALAGTNLDAVAAAARDLLTGSPLTSGDLGRLLGERWPDVHPQHLAYTARCFLPLVQVTPRGLWGANGPGTTTTWTTADAWFGRPSRALLDPDERAAALVRLVRRYLAAFGPATVMDAQRWSGLTGLRDAVGRLRPELVTFTGPDGKEYLDLPDAPRPGAGAPAPLVLVAEFDNLVLGHADRTRVVDDVRRKAITTVNGQVPGTVLVDGYVVATWKVRRVGTRPTTTPDAVAQLDVSPLGHTFTRAQRAALDARGTELLRFVAPEASEHVVTVTAS
ncbi:winged helix DNA-binding domain-containing protein [Oerskovia sp. USHLN155]|uniref:winged helix DNA-binding domain-containing protein n=1 Tax=Oerskovia sp. USHLN155 TaxID=3081288 RepID=UPI0030178B40